MSTLSYRPTSNGTGGNIAFTIDSFSESEIEVYVDGVKRTNGGSNNFDFTIPDYSATSGTVTWNTSGSNAAPTSSNKVRIQRRTKVLNNAGNAVEGKATYSAGAAVKATDLNNNTKQALRAIQEKQDQLVQTYDIDASAVQTSNIKDANITTAKIAPDNITNALIADNQIDSEHYVDGSIDRVHLEADIIDGTKLADNAVDSEHYTDGSIDRIHLEADIIDSTKLADNSVNSEHYVDGSIDEQHIANSQVTSTKIADNAITTTEILNGAVTRAKLEADAIDGTKLADNAVNSEHYTDGSIDRVHLSADIIDSTKLEDNAVNSEHYVDGSIDREHLAADIVDGTKIADDSVNSEHIAAGALDNEHYAAGSITSDKLNGATVITSSEQASATTNDTSFLTSAAADARFFNISSGDTIKDGQSFPDNDTTIATTAAINDRIIDIVNDIGGFDIIQSEQHFPDTNPQGVAGQAAVLSIKAASTNLAPSGTTVTITNGNLANNANIIITGVTSTIPQDFGFLVESTSTLHTYSFHRLVPKATEVTTVAGKATEIGRLGTAAAVEDMSILGTTDVVADMAILGTTDVVADMNTLATSDIVSDMNTLAVADVLSDMSTVADNVTNVNNVGNNITNVNSVSNSAGANQTFTVTVQNVSGNKYFIDGVQTPVLKLARGKTYTFDMSDSSNSGHPLAFRDSSDNSYTTGVTTSGTAGSSGATVVIVVAANAPSSLKYYCTSHGNSMGNTITVIDDNVGTVAGSISNVNTVGTAITNVNNVGSDISNVNTVATNISSVNSFANTYRIGSTNPTTSLDTGDLFFNTTTDSLKVYTGSAWVDGVTQTGNFALKTGNTFTGSNVYNDTVKAKFGTGADLEIFHNGSDSKIREATGSLNLICNSSQSGDGINLLHSAESMLRAINDGAVELYYDNSKKFETTNTGVAITGAATTSSLTVSGDQLVGHGNSTGNQIKFARSGLGDELVIGTDGYGSSTQYEATIQSSIVTARPLVFRTNNTDRLRILGGGGIQIPNDNAKLQIGAGQDLELFHDGVDNHIDVAQTLSIRTGGETSAQFDPNGSVYLFHDNSKKLETSSTGVTITGRLNMTEGIDIPDGGDNNTSLSIGSGNDLRLYHDGSHSYIKDRGAGNLYIQSNLVNIDTDHGEQMINCIKDGAVELYHNNVKKLETTADGATISGVTVSTGNIQINNDTGKIRLGASQDFELYHDGTNSRITNSTGALSIQADDININNAVNNEQLASLTANGSVELFYDHSKKFETYSHGIRANQNIDIDGSLYLDDADTSNGTGILYLGNSQDLQIYHDGTNSYVSEVGTGNLKLTSSGAGVEIQKSQTEYLGRFLTDGQVELYHNNSKKIETTSTGFEAYGGQFRFNGVEGGASQLLIYADEGDDANDKWRVMAGGSNDFIIGNLADGSWDTNIKAVGDGQVELYYNDSKKLETVTGGVYVYGDLGFGIGTTGNLFGGDNDKVILGSGNDLQLYHDGTKSYIDNNTGDLEIVTPARIELQGNNGSETMARFTTNGATELFYDNSKKFGTTADGAEFFGGGSNNVYLNLNTSDNTIRGYIYANSSNRVGFLNNGGSWVAQFDRGSNCFLTGHWLPDATNTYDLGSTSKRWANVYTNDLNLSNEGSSNDVDNTWGDWTIQEGESDLFLKNNRSGKKYKFNLTEVS